MNVLVTGPTGMVGQGVVRECLNDPGVERVVTVGRTSSGARDSKLNEVLIANFDNWTEIGPELERLGLTQLDACFFCLGVSAAGMKEPDYARITYDYTLAAAEALSRINPAMTFIYVSGAGTDSSGKSTQMWARVKGRTENALLRLPLNSFMFRPGLIQPLDGIKSRTRWYRILYAVTGVLLPLLHRLVPNHVVTTREMGQAMLAVARRGYGKRVLEMPDLRTLLRQRSSL